MENNIFFPEDKSDASVIGQSLKIDFKKKDGFLRSLRRSAELGLYRQDYCGCVFSKRDRDARVNRNC